MSRRMSKNILYKKLTGTSAFFGIIDFFKMYRIFLSEFVG
jgi:hypothetical protein